MSSIRLLLLLALLPVAAFGEDWQDYVSGSWVIEKDIPTSGIASLTQEEANEFIGTKAFYSKEMTRFGSTECNSPVYNVDNINESDFFSGTYNSFTELGISSSEIYQVSVSCDDQGAEWWEGGFLFSKDKDHLIVLIEGVYFELHRSKI
ncbi:hypothetical protein [Microbulbifer hydrolyticus]|uniref:Uncharacterized protein n=1 Tax=Microbulbifer hydrolyticus TaxID=48074 RepID=A0A6P1T7I0_9GAMM|nr:hypothetical protein [Microbulbifer hydrolyticus]MBB5211504.1 hypothetical protein [Microbulbifer hydrolyticus]QHQ37751.1 hypothetical protein GTQ55_01280 [Microbulbifer hydrolyticus]